MNIGLGLIAADEYFKEGDRREVRDDQRDRRAYDQKVRQADLSMLDDRTAATRSGYRDQVAERDARAQTRPGQTANTIKRQGVEGVGLDRAAARQGKVEDTADINADLGLGQAQANQKNQPAKLSTEAGRVEIDAALMELGVEELPRVIAQKRQQGAITDAQAGIVSMAKLVDLVKVGDTNAALKFMNDMAAASGKPGQAVANVGITTDPKTGEKVFVAQSADGKPVVQLTQAQMSRIQQAAGTGGKTEYKTVNAGDSLVAVNGGTATPVYTAPESEKSRAAKIGPLERDVNYLVNEHGMSKDQALQRLQSAKVKSRQQFIMDQVTEKAKMGTSSTPEQEAEYGQMWDRINGQGRGGQPGQSNPSPAPTMPTDPALRGLLNIPPR